MARIERLTDEQKGRLVEFRKEWLQVGMCCDPADFEAGDEIIRGFYARIGKPAPTILHFSSPAMCELAVNVVMKTLKDPPGQLGDQLWGQLGGQLRGQLGDQLWGQLGDHLGDHLGGQLWDQIRGQLRDQLGGQLRGQLGDQLWGQLWDQLGGQLGDQLWGQLWDQLGGQLWDQLWGQIGGQLGDQLWDQLWGQLGDHLGDHLGGQLWDQIRGQLRDQLGGQLRGQLRDQLGGQLRGQLGDQLGGQLWDQLGGQLWDQLGGQLRGQLRGQLWGQLGGQLWDQLGGQLRGQLGGQLGDQLWGHFQRNSFDNQYNVAWGAFYLFGHEIGVEYKAENMALLLEWARLFKSVGWWAPWEGICFVSDRPRKVSFDEAGRLHSEVGKAVEYSDGWGVSAWHGTRVPDHWISDRATLDPNEVIKAQNVEQRAAGAAIIGWPRMLSVLKAKVIDDSGNADIGQLIELTLPGLPEPGRFLKAECPRNGIIVEGVPRVSDIDGLPIDTALAAQAWRIGDPQSEYEHPPRRT